jgi:futalosine hydrolase
MPKFLAVAATKFEVQPLLTHFHVPVYADTGCFVSDASADLSVLITGVGMVNTAYHLGRYSHNLFDHIINFGVCGAFNKNLKLGEVVNVTEDRISGLGAENGEEFIPFEDMGLGGTAVYHNLWNAAYAPLSALEQVKGLTVNTVHGHEDSIRKVMARFGADVESMEGAAYFRGCERLSGNYIQLRAVSNYVEKRDKSKWQMPLAITNGNEFVIKMINDLNI